MRGKTETVLYCAYKINYHPNAEKKIATWEKELEEMTKPLLIFPSPWNSKTVNMTAHPMNWIRVWGAVIQHN